MLGCKVGRASLVSAKFLTLEKFLLIVMMMFPKFSMIQGFGYTCYYYIIIINHKT